MGWHRLVWVGLGKAGEAAPAAREVGAWRCALSVGGMKP